MDFRTVTVTTITKDSTSGIITFSTPISANPERNGIAFACKPTDYIGLDDQRQYIEVSNGYRGIKFSVHNEITITGDPASPYAEVGEDYTSEDYKDKIEDIYQYLVTSIMVDCPCDVSVFGGPVGGVSTGGNTAGTTGTVASQIVYVGGNNITLSQSINGQSATITVSGPNTSPSLSVGVSTIGNTVGDTALVTGQFVLAGGNNVTLSGSTDGGSMTVTVSNPPQFLAGMTQSLGFNLGDTGFVTGRLALFGTKYLSLSGSTDGGSMSISVVPNATVSAFAYGNTTVSTNAGWEINELGIYGSGMISIGVKSDSPHGFIVSATQSNQDLSLYATGNTTLASSGTINASSIIVNGSDNISVGISNGSVVIKGGASGGGGLAAGISTQGNTSGTTGFVTASSYQLVGSYDIGLSQSTDGTGATVTIQRHIESTYMRPMEAGIGSISAIVAGTASVVPAAIPFNVTGTNLDLVISNAITTAGNNSTAGINYSVTAVLHTRSGNTLFSIASTTQTFGVTWSSNNTARVTGAVYMPMPLNLNLSAGYYFLAAQIATANTGGIITGANTTQLNNTVAMMGVPTGVFSAMSFREIGNATDESNGFFQGQGIYSSTGNLTEISMSAISNVGTRGQRANIAFRIRG